MSSLFQSPAGKPSPGPAGRLAAGSPHGSSGSLLAAAAAAAGGSTPPAAPHACPRTPEAAFSGGARSSRSVARSGGSVTPPSDSGGSGGALSLVSATTAASFSADARMFAPASTDDAVHAVPSLLSQLLSGRTDEQVLAARKLHAYCRHGGRPVEAAIAAAGGVHMLLIMLDSLERGLRDVCTRILTDLAADDRIRAEILSAPAGGAAKVIQLMYRGVLEGQASAGRFLELLATSRSEAVQAALCHSKVVRLLCKTVDSAPTPAARSAALSALQAFCRQDPANLRKLVWGGGVEALLGVLAEAAAPSPADAAAALQLLGAALALQGEAAGSLASVAAVASLARFVGAPDQPLALQADAAGLLVAVAAVPVKRAGVQQALTDLVLPRAFEIVHEAAAAAAASASEANAAAAGAEEDASSAAAAAAEAADQRRLQAAAAAIVGQLVQQDSECCHSILFHAQLLRPATAMLIAGGRFAAAQQLLEAARAYAAALGGSSACSAGGSGGTPTGH